MITFKDIFKQSFLDSFSTENIPTLQVAESFLIAAVLGAFLFFLYQHVTKKYFYDKYFNMSLPILAVIVCGIVLTIQLNVVVSLGMVGALSIVRFRTAVKSPMDLIFLFWAIAIGIICGAFVYIIAIVMTAGLTAGLFIMELLPVAKAPVLLIIHAQTQDCKKDIEDVVAKHTKRWFVKSQTIETKHLNMIIEVRVKNSTALLSEIADIPSVVRCSVVNHDGEVTF